MKKYKVCPKCGTRFESAYEECDKCFVRLNVAEEKEDIPLQKEPVFIKKCDCGAENPPAARKCSSCDEDISDIVPTPKTEKSCKQYVLSEISGSFSYDVPNDSEIILGRENVLREFIFDKSYVSRRHAKLVAEGDNLYITNLNGTNFTFVNNEKISNDTPTQLKADDEIGLGGCVINGNRQNLAVYLVVREK